MSINKPKTIFGNGVEPLLHINPFMYPDGTKYVDMAHDDKTYIVVKGVWTPEILANTKIEVKLYHDEAEPASEPKPKKTSASKKTTKKETTKK